MRKFRNSSENPTSMASSARGTGNIIELNGGCSMAHDRFEDRNNFLEDHAAMPLQWSITVVIAHL